MPETHLYQFVVPFAMAVWWTKSWLMDPVLSRWRYLAAGLAGTIVWVWLAFAATRVATNSAGVTVVYGSTGLAYVGAFMALLSFLGTIWGLVVWTEETGEQAIRAVPDRYRDWGGVGDER